LEYKSVPTISSFQYANLDPLVLVLERSLDPSIGQNSGVVVETEQSEIDRYLAASKLY